MERLIRDGYFPFLESITSMQDLRMITLVIKHKPLFEQDAIRRMHKQSEEKAMLLLFQWMDENQCRKFKN